MKLESPNEGSSKALSEYEANALREIHEWKNPQLGWFGQAMKVINWPLQKAGDVILDTPGVGEVIEKSVGGFVRVCNDVAAWSVRPGAVFDEFRKAGLGEVKEPTDIFSLDLEEVDRVIGWLDMKYKGIALAEGAGTGAIGLPKLPAQHAITTAGKAYESLSKDTTPEKIKEIVTWTAADEIALTELQARLKEADPAAAAKKKQAEKGQIETLQQALQEGISALSADSFGALRSLKVDAAERRKVAKEGAQATGATAMLEGVGSVTWKAMWDAAKAYSTTEAYPGLPFPHTGDGAHCVLCHQDLDEEAKQRLQGFEEFVRGVLEAEAEKAEKAIAEGLKAIPARPTTEALTASCQAAALGEELQEVIEAAWTTLEALLAPIREGNIPDAPPELDDTITGLPARLEKLASAAKTAAKDLESDAKSSDRSQARAKAAELQGKKWVTDQAEAVRAEVDRLKEWAEYEKWKKKTATTGISRKAGEIAKQLITDAYIQRFNDELKKLGASRIQVELVKATTERGRPKHTIQLRDVAVKGSRPVEILSEGERRIVAMAAFIADVTGRNVSAPFVFDDPVSSLDQDFEEKVIARLVGLSQDRQVLVFTHRLSFLGIMTGLAGSGLHDVHIRREPWGTGQPGEVPLFARKPDKALNNLKGERVPKARKAHENDGYDAYYPLAKAICSDFRILMERLVETVFLADVVQRHRRAVNTMGKIGNLVKIEQSDCDLIDEMMTKYSCYEHSQSEEAPVDVPEPDELEKDIERMVRWHKEFTKR